MQGEALAREHDAGERGRPIGLSVGAERAVVAVGAAVSVGALLAANGGFFPVSWSWATLALLWAAALGLTLRAVARPSALELVFAGALTSLVAWVFLSVVWTSDVTQTIFEGERSLVLLAATGAVLALAPRRPTGLLLGGVLTAIAGICLYALLTRLFPSRVGTFDPLAGYRLNTPVGYWNGLGITAVLGALLATGFALRAQRRGVAALAAASLLVLLPTLYFTYGRGAWLALGFGLVAALLLDPRRLELATGLIVLGSLPALAVLLASRSHALTRQASTLAAARHDGHRLALLLVLLAVLEALLALALRSARTRVTMPRAVRAAWACVLIAVVVAAIAAVSVRWGSPPTLARRAYDAFVAPPPQHVVDLNKRLFSISGNGRADLWRAAWHEAQAAPVLGGGAGSYDRYWRVHRPNNQNVQDAHNLYLETLAELGPVGLLLLLVALATPLVAAVRARRHPLVPLGAAAYVAYLAHATADWDWELVGVTLAAVLCGLACLAAARDDRERPLGPRVRAAGVVTATILAGFTIVGLLGNTALESSDAAAQAGRWNDAARHAHSAIRWMPWSAAGWQRLGEAQSGLKDYAAARRSLRRGLARDPGNWVLWLDLAGATRGDEQVAAVKQVLRLNPLDPTLGEYLASVVKP